MSSKSSDEKLKKKLKAFFDKNASLGKRWKSLTSYVEKASDEDLNKFFNENFYMIYGVFFDSFTAYENSCKKGKHSNSEVTDMMLVLRNVLTHLSELIRKKWQTRSIAAVLEKLLYKENRINVRVPGFTLLLIFLEAVQVLEAPQVDLFASSIDMSVFAVGPNQSTRFRKVALTAPDKTCVLVPSNNAGNPENSVKLWEDMLAYMTNKATVFEFWMEHLKKQYFSIFYPEVSKRVGISEDDCGFPAYCPHPIQKVNITHLAIWLSNPQISTILWSSEENIQLVLEMFRQCCKLPISYADTIRVGITTFLNLFISRNFPFPKEMEDRLVEFRKFFFQQLSSVFRINAEDKQQEHANLCLEVVAQFKQIFLERYESFALETQECLLNTLLDTTIEVCKNNNASTTALARTMLDTVFFIWIHTKRNTEEMWANLQRGISSTFGLMESITQTRLKLIQLTLLIKKTMYPIRKVKKKPPQRDADGNEIAAKELPQSVCPDSRKPLIEDAVDPNISTMTWENIDELIYVWNQVLQTFQTVNSIADPVNHAAAIKVICEVIEHLQRAEEGIPHASRSEMEREPLCLIDIFGHWLFEACYLPDSYIQGKALAVGSLCRLIVRHYGDSLPLELLSHFYAIVALCFKNHPNSIVSWSILQNSSNIFNLALPGGNVLIPHYTAEIKRVVKAQNITTDVRLKTIIITVSLICYPNHLESLSCPLDFNGSSGEYDFANALRKDITSILIDYANLDPDPEHKVMCIWGLCSLICEDLTHSPNIAMIKEITRTTLPFCTSSDPLVARAALDSLSTLTLFYDQLNNVDESLISIIIDILCSNIHRQLLEAKQSKAYVLNENLVADHFYCLLDWIMASTTYLFNKRQVATKIFEAIELGLLGQKLQIDSSVPVVEKKKQKRLSAQPLTIEAQLSELLESLTAQPTHGSNTIKEAAHILLIQLCNFLQNFPCKEGIEIMSSQVSETDDIFKDQKPLFFIYNDFALFSLVEVPLPDGSHMCRLILRDCTGKYAWDSKINYNNYIHEIPPAYSLLSEPVIPPTEKEPPVYSQSDRQPGVAPKASDEPGPPVDQLDDLLQYLGEVFPDCLPENGAPLNQPSEVRAEYKNSVQEIEKALLQQADADASAIETLAKNVPPYQDWAVIPPEPQTPASPLHHCRLFLNHLGFLTFDKQNAFSMVDYSQRFTRSLAQLDKSSGREMLKIGVIYVKEGQDDQKIIFRNDTKSDLYAEFVRGLGWPIDVATHRGYLGGLDPKQTTGVSAPYYANSIMEVIFHEITSMPTNPTDNQQIHKKRHVGNDIVHIVYSEDTSDYAPTTITSQFNDAHVVVYPLPNGLFRIQVYRKENVQVFGPLVHGMCVNKELLVPLVRQTAINANRYVRYNTGGYNVGYTRPFPTRRRALDEIVERFKVARPYEELVNELLDA